MDEAREYGNRFLQQVADNTSTRENPRLKRCCGYDITKGLGIVFIVVGLILISIVIFTKYVIGSFKHLPPVVRYIYPTIGAIGASVFLLGIAILMLYCFLSRPPRNQSLYINEEEERRPLIYPSNTTPVPPYLAQSTTVPALTDVDHGSYLYK